MSKRLRWILLLVALVHGAAILPQVGAQDENQPSKSDENCGVTDSSDTKPNEDQPQWKSLFDGKSLGDWKPTPFGGQGEVYVDQDGIVLDFGSPLTGVTYAKEFPKEEYELRVQARRDEGTDFFCGLTFPVGDSHCTFILGGWGGALVGLSNIDYLDASQNKLRQHLPLENDRWYDVIVRVTYDHVRVSLDGKTIIEQPREGHQFNTRPEVERSKPLGIAAFDTRASVRRICYRTLRE